MLDNVVAIKRETIPATSINDCEHLYAFILEEIDKCVLFLKFPGQDYYTVYTEDVNSDDPLLYFETYLQGKRFNNNEAYRIARAMYSYGDRKITVKGFS